MWEATQMAWPCDTNGGQQDSKADALWTNGYGKENKRKTQAEIQGQINAKTTWPSITSTQKLGKNWPRTDLHGGQH